MLLNDAWDTVLTRKAEEAPGGIAPLVPGVNYGAASAPVTTPAPQQIVITGQRIPALPSPIQLPTLQTDSWTRITQARAAFPQSRSISWSQYIPWALGGLALLAAISLFDERSKSKSKRARV